MTKTKKDQGLQKPRKGAQGLRLEFGRRGYPSSPAEASWVTCPGGATRRVRSKVGLTWKQMLCWMLPTDVEAEKYCVDESVWSYLINKNIFLVLSCCKTKCGLEGDYSFYCTLES